MRRFNLLILLMSITLGLGAQTIMEQAEVSLKKMQVRYKNLEDAQVKIKIRKRGSAMAASYTWWSVFRKPAKRKYKVILNKNVNTNYLCFQFDHLSEISRDGVIAHELGHVDFFHSISFFGFLKFILQQAIPNGLRKSERATDYRTIKNGMAKELRAWSAETRRLFLESEGKEIPHKYSSRYLTPAEIDSVMLLFPELYK